MGSPREACFLLVVRLPFLQEDVVFLILQFGVTGDLRDGGIVVLVHLLDGLWVRLVVHGESMADVEEGKKEN